MKKRRIAILIGTRPEALKMAPVWLALKSSVHMEAHLVTTAQHREMLDQALEAFGIRPEVDLDLMDANQPLGDLGARVLAGVQKVLHEMRPDAVLVHGDTSTCLFSALAAFYERIPVGHVEAGLRTYDFEAPWPEEMNRRLTDPISTWCFAPTERAAQNLRAERIPENRVFVTGNTIVDAVLIARERARDLRPAIPGLPEAALAGLRLILVTGHRRESFGKPFEQFCLALRDVVRAHPDTVLVYPVHMNPNVRKAVHETLKGEDRIYLVEPLDYLSFIHLMDRCHLIISDSGGIQEEAPSLGKPLLVTRTVTERPEAVEAGLAKLVGTSRERILSEASNLLLGSGEAGPNAQPGMAANPFGDGRASERIVKILEERL